MSHRGCIRATQGQRLLHRLLQAFPTVPLAEREQLDHLPRAWVFAMPFLQTQPQPVETLRPPSAFAPLPQRTRSRQRSRFLLQHVEIVLQIEHLLIAPETALVPRHALPFLPDLDISRQQFRLWARPRLQRRRITVGAHLHAALAVHRRETGLRQLETFRRQRQQLLAFAPQRLTDWHCFACDPPLFVLLAATA